MHSILIQTEKTDVPVVLVGGGSCLVDRSVGIHGASSLITPHKHWVRTHFVCQHIHTCTYTHVHSFCQEIYNMQYIQHVAHSPCPLTLMCYTSSLVPSPF